MRVQTDDRIPLRLWPGARTLIYFPHGLGDWVQLSYVTPLLDASDRIAITRLGDDFVAVLDGADGIHAVRSGVRAPQGPVHRPRPLRLPPRVRALADMWGSDVAIWPEFHDRGGGDPFPFHTKARRFARAIVPPERLAVADLDRPLRSGIPLAVAPGIAAAVEPRVRAFVGRGERLCVLVRGGRSDPRKTWGHAWREDVPAAQRREGSEARAFVDALGPGWRVVTFEDDTLGAGERTWRGADRVIAWATLAAGAFDRVPFGLALRAVLAHASLAVGVPAGPFHLAHARRDVPVVGIWLHQHPDWYDEPNPLARHVVGHDVVVRGWHRRRASTSRPATWAHAIELLPSRVAPAEAVLEAARALGAL